MSLCAGEGGDRINDSVGSLAGRWRLRPACTTTGLDLESERAARRLIDADHHWAAPVAASSPRPRSHDRVRNLGRLLGVPTHPAVGYLLRRRHIFESGWSRLALCLCSLTPLSAAGWLGFYYSSRFGSRCVKLLAPLRPTFAGQIGSAWGFR